MVREVVGRAPKGEQIRQLTLKFGAEIVQACSQGLILQVVNWSGHEIRKCTIFKIIMLPTWNTQILLQICVFVLIWSEIVAFS